MKATLNSLAMSNVASVISSKRHKKRLSNVVKNNDEEIEIVDDLNEKENDFDDFILCYGEELGVPLDKEVVQFEIKTD